MNHKELIKELSRRVVEQNAQITELQSAVTDAYRALVEAQGQRVSMRARPGGL